MRTSQEVRAELALTESWQSLKPTSLNTLGGWSCSRTLNQETKRAGEGSGLWGSTQWGGGT